MFGDLTNRGIHWYLENPEKVDDTHTVWQEYISESNTNPGNWVGLTLASIYFIMPADLIPDWIPVIGYADDVIVLKYGWNIGGAIWEVGSWIAEALD